MLAIKIQNLSQFSSIILEFSGSITKSLLKKAMQLLYNLVLWVSNYYI